MTVVGVDGCRIGWLSIELAGDQWYATCHRDIGDLWAAHHDSDLILIDVPIGLRCDGPEQRPCEAEARRLLGRRGCTVFTPPLRSTLRQVSYAEASTHNHALSGRKLTKQTWGIAGKIDEVDRFLRATPAARGRLRETHPEICFWALNDGAPAPYPKKQAPGRSFRHEVLSRALPFVDDVVSDIRSRYRKNDVADDDIYDALAAALTARHCLVAGPLTLPSVRELDEFGLPMEMVYARPG